MPLFTWMYFSAFMGETAFDLTCVCSVYVHTFIEITGEHQHTHFSYSLDMMES